MTRSEIIALVRNEVKDLEGRLGDRDYEECLDRAIEYLRDDVIIKNKILQPYAPTIDLSTLPKWGRKSIVLGLFGIYANRIVKINDNLYSIINNTLYLFDSADKLIIEYKIEPEFEDFVDYKIDLVFLATAFCFLRLANSYAQSSSPVVDAQVDFRTKRDEYVKQAKEYFALYENRKEQIMKRRAKSEIGILNINTPRDAFFH
jgi:hypothetical protein